jgi:glycosyltransferase involved in cell wall biosynthesis
MKEKISASVGILTFNNEATIRRALESVSDFAQVIICDGGSTDSTLEIAREFNVDVINQSESFKDSEGKLIDYSGPRNQMLNAARFDWFTFIDSDEIFSEKLVESIRSVVEKESSGCVYKMHRRFMHKGNIIVCSVAYPNFQIRFFRISEVNSFIKPIHERIDYPVDIHVSDLVGFLYVPLDVTAEELKIKWRRYLIMQDSFLSKSNFQKVVYSFYDLVKYSLVYSVRFLKCRIFHMGPKLPVSLELVWFWQLFKTFKLNVINLVSRNRN